MRRNVAGALSLVALVAGERKPPHVAGMHLTTSRGLILNLNNSRIAAKRCHYNTGGYMTLAELGMAFWHDLAVPVITGILASMIVSWLNKRK
ncbi:toxic polypeptide, small [Escherichia coli]|nr:toxic polypeptide, small [Escherichia coli]PPE53550.1 type I toxin-antitoxin system toxin Ldr family protein [Escherichia coli]